MIIHNLLLSCFTQMYPAKLIKTYGATSNNLVNVLLIVLIHQYCYLSHPKRPD